MILELGDEGKADFPSLAHRQSSGSPLTRQQR